MGRLGSVGRMRQMPGYAAARDMPVPLRLRVLREYQNGTTFAVRYLRAAQGAPAEERNLRQLIDTVKCLAEMQRLEVWE